MHAALRHTEAALATAGVVRRQETHRCSLHMTSVFVKQQLVSPRSVSPRALPPLTKAPTISSPRTETPQLRRLPNRPYPPPSGRAVASNMTPSPRRSNARMAQFTNGFVSCNFGSPPEWLRYVDNGLGKQTLLRNLEPVREERAALRRQRVLNHAERLSREQLQLKERRTQWRLRKQHEHEKTMELAKRESAARVLQEYTRRTVSHREARRLAKLRAEEHQKKIFACTRIQKYARDWLRRSLQNPALRLKRLYEVTCKLQSAVRGYLVKRDYRVVRAKALLVTNEAYFDAMLQELRTSSATKIQGMVRGRAGRRVAARKRMGLSPEARAILAAIRMQCNYRRRKARQMAKTKRGHHRHRSKPRARPERDHLSRTSTTPIKL